MFATVYKVVREGLFVYVNEKSCCTRKMFIPNKNIEPWIQFVPGDQIVYNISDKKVVRGNFINCYFCHKSMDCNDGAAKCDCKSSEIDLLTSQGVLTSKEHRFYKSGAGIKIKLETEDADTTIHSVVFESNALFTAFQEIPLGVLVHFKGIVKKMDNKNVLVNIFNIW